ncbi:PepSY domain-containing protein [Mameliella alba]|nr:PepSY domain-containing protein [Mameliella alba]MBY6169987.1 PepSY domain-containing protein [Mameliella alba]MBY6175036.1 PepSY domain-containing protein [Mameliella alba]
MTRTLVAAALAGLIALPLFASSDETDVTLDADRKAEITQLLTQQGYEVRKIESEDGEIEVYALKDGQHLELTLDAELNITDSENDD